MQPDPHKMEEVIQVGDIDLDMLREAWQKRAEEKQHKKRMLQKDAMEKQSKQLPSSRRAMARQRYTSTVLLRGAITSMPTRI